MSEIDDNRSPKKSVTMSKEVYNLVQDYSEDSTIQGLVYIFKKEQTLCGKIFWILVVSLMLILGIYWSVSAYNDWQSNPVLTTIKTSAFPIKDVEFPAVTICGQGADTDILTSGFLTLFLNFLKKNGINLGVSPIKASVLLKQAYYVQVIVKILYILYFIFFFQDIIIVIPYL